MNLVQVGSSSAARLLAWPVAQYITHQRDRLTHASTTLSSSSRAQLYGYFGPIDLDRARIVESDPLPIPDSPFSRHLRRLGFDFPGPSLISAITLDYVIATRKPIPTDLLFHELVHVVQFRLLGVAEFARLYTQGFLSERCYDRIPLERCAFELAHRFSTEGLPFDVESEVVGRIERKLF